MTFTKESFSVIDNNLGCYIVSFIGMLVFRIMCTIHCRLWWSICQAYLVRVYSITPDNV